MAHKILTICGSLRKGSFNRALMNTLPGLAPADMSFTEMSSFAELPAYNADIQAAGFPGQVKKLVDEIRAADGVIITSPEYNFSIPGALKNALDWISRVENQPFAGKPVALQSASGGPVGGARMQYHLRMTMQFLNAATFNAPEIFVGTAQTKFDASLQLTDENTKKFVTQQLAAFAKFIDQRKS